MKRIYLIAWVVFCAGSMFAQNTKTVQKDPAFKRPTSVTRKAAVTTTTSTNTLLVTKEAEQPQTTVTTLKKVDGKVVFTQEELNKKSERGRAYILAHPELYIVEEK